MITRKLTQYQERIMGMKTLSEKEGSPCLECLVKSACTKSFINQSACEKFVIFLHNIMMKAGMKINENKD